MATIAATASRNVGSRAVRCSPSPSPDHRGRPCSAAESSSGERRGARAMAPILPPISSAVDAALGLAAAGPPPGAGVLARRDRPGAGRAADGAVAELEQRVDRHLVPLDVGVDVV